jgi:hypothetical protein
MPPDIRKLVVHLEEVRAEGGRGDTGGPLRKVAALAVVPNPYAGRPWSGDLDELVEPSGALAAELAAASLAVLGAPLAGELVVGLAFTNRGRLNARLGGLAKEEVVGQDGLR